MSDSDAITIPAAVQAVFDEHAAPTHASTRAVHDQLSPILRVVSLVQKQLIEHKAKLDEAELSDVDGLLLPKLEHLRQTIGAADREVTALAEHARAAAKCFAQLDRNMADSKTDVANVLTAARARAAASNVQS